MAPKIRRKKKKKTLIRSSYSSQKRFYGRGGELGGAER